MSETSGAGLTAGPTSTRPQALVIAGMHRSGTSALARTLEHLGADAPRTPLPPGKGEEIHWGESEPIVAAHDEMLASAGSSWDDVSPLPVSWHESAVGAGFRARMVDLVAREYPGSDLWLVKDPRICRLVPCWLGVLAEAGAEPAFVLLIRNPLEVAESLARRDGFSLPKGLLLWLRHALDSERDTRGRRRTFVHYDDLLRDWRSAARSIADATDLEWPRAGREAEVEIDRFMSADRRRSTFTLEELAVRREVVSWVVEAHRLLLDACRSGREPDSAALDAIDAALRDADLAYGPVVAESRIDAEGWRRRAAHLKGRLDASGSALDKARDELGEARSGRDELQARLTATQRRLREAERAADGARERLGTTEAELGSARAELRRAESNAAEGRRLLASIERSLSWRLTRPLRYAKALIARGGRRLPPRPRE